MSTKVKYALKPGASIGFAGYWQNGPVRGIIRGDLSWCLADPTRIDLYLSGVSGLAIEHNTPKALPVWAGLEAFSGSQLTGRLSIDLKDLTISGSLQPWLRFSGVVAANWSSILGMIEAAGLAYALYDPFLSHELVIVTGIGTGIGISPPVNLITFLTRLGVEIKWMGEFLFFFETVFIPGALDGGTVNLNHRQGGSAGKTGIQNIIHSLRPLIKGRPG